MFVICGIMLYYVNEQRSSLRTREVDSFLFCNILKDKEGYRPMDEIDLKLLRLLQKNSRTPIQTLACQVRLSSPAVSARIERLEKQGVIRAYTLDLDPLQLGHHILAYVHLDMQPAQKAAKAPRSGRKSAAGRRFVCGERPRQAGCVKRLVASGV